MTEHMSDLLFDEPYYLAINEARWPVCEHLLQAARQTGDIASVLDAGCGPGWFAERMTAKGLDVLGVDARLDLVEEARRRAPEAAFEVFDFDSASLDQPPAAQDAVLAFGLLYHLENPLRALRLCRASARRALLLETMTIPEPGRMARLLGENTNETQGKRNMALVMTPEAVVGALFGVGFRHVYRYVAPIAHPDFSAGPGRLKRRDVFLATDYPAGSGALEECFEEHLGRYDYHAGQSPTSPDAP